MLVVGIPFIDRTSSWLLVNILANFDLSLADWFCPPHYSCIPDYVPGFFDIWKPLLLGYLYYFHVRHLGRTTLSLLWAYAFAIAAISTVTSLLNVAIDPQWWFNAPGSWWGEIHTLIFLFVVIWFARQASKISFSHALVLIGLSNFLYTFGTLSNLVLPLLEGTTVAWDFVALNLAGILFALWVLLRLGVDREKHEKGIERWTGSWDMPIVGAKLRSLALRVLPGFDPARGISKELLVALFGLNLLLHVYWALRYWDTLHFETADSIAATVVTFTQVLVAYAYAPLWTALVILLTYAVRVRQPLTTESTARPTKPFLSPSYGPEEKPPIS